LIIKTLAWKLSTQRLAALLLGVGFFTPATFAQPAAVPAGVAASATSATSISSDEKLRQFMQQIRPQPDAARAGGQAVRDAQSVSAERLTQRSELLKQGELLLSQRRPADALTTFERAALILHAADSEMAIVRSHMQAGDYRRALAFGAHTAGAHLDVVGGSALYAWLLYAGGQTQVAQRLLAEAKARSASSPLIAAVSAQLDTGQPRATGSLLALPTRLAPYGDASGIPKSARVVGSAALLPGGTLALVPAAFLSPAKAGLWLRNGLGQTAQATVTQRLPELGVAVVSLIPPLAVAEDYSVAPRDAFAGSIGYAIEYPSLPTAEAAWPLLHAGFLGGQADAIDPASSWRSLGIAMPKGPRGGPVFDAAGRLAGIALPRSSYKGKTGAADLMVPVSALKVALGARLAEPPIAPAQPQGGPSPKAAMDRVYESALKSSLQVIR
jgi:hypothetical protein